jgi:ethanolaminephosphotransferase
MGIAAFMYIHLDALDGKQARRTGTSSPLGQLFDHGCDCINLIFMILMFWSVFGYANGLMLPFYASLCYAVFITTTWEEFHTGLLELDFFNGPVEGTTILSVCSLLTGIFGIGVALITWV